ncbi:MAG: glycosyltransferase family 1 protein [Thiofilum sp.]|uniref:glycosyltransferase family 4 protein n=1 Tax=Thiofilum sp. TaxID=2212733 RepID=UPI0025DFB378|nr:glycosyltransferase family 1 protein [Thiofilum sp.]MBK8453448.1 glycosyltransferase family 1 protein [Thiofilum sp.]
MALTLAVVTETWPPEINGVAHTIAQLVHRLHSEFGYCVQLIRPRQSQQDQASVRPDFSEHLVASWRLPFYPQVRLGAPAAYLLYRLWKQQRPDVVQIVTEGPLGYAALWIAQTLKIPVISDFHTHFDQYSDYYRLGIFKNLASRYLRSLHNQTLFTLVPTQSLCQYLSTKGYKNLALLARGIDADLFNPNQRSNALRQRLGVSNTDLLVVLVARLAHEKNLDLAFQAFQRLQHTQPNAQFLVVGDGPERSRLQKTYPFAHFAGMQTGVALAQHYASGDLFLYPSLSETFGNVITEAMASGLPVVAFNYAAAQEHIQHEVNGWVVPFGDHAAFIEQTLQAAQASHRATIATHARATALTLDWYQVTEQLHQLLQQAATTKLQ